MTCIPLKGNRLPELLHLFIGRLCLWHGHSCVGYMKESNKDRGTTPLPPLLAAWIKERGFDACDWLPVPVHQVRKIRGRDAYRFGKIVLVRPLLGEAQGTSDHPEQAQTRYYVAIHLTTPPRQTRGKAVGYWLVVKAPVAPTTTTRRKRTAFADCIEIPRRES